MFTKNYPALKRSPHPGITRGSRNSHSRMSTKKTTRMFFSSYLENI